MKNLAERSPPVFAQSHHVTTSVIIGKSTRDITNPVQGVEQSRCSGHRDRTSLANLIDARSLGSGLQIDQHLPGGERQSSDTELLRIPDRYREPEPKRQPCLGVILFGTPRHPDNCTRQAFTSERLAPLMRLVLGACLALIAACSSTSTLQNGQIGGKIPIQCGRETDCELRAQRTCGGTDYHVHSRHKIGEVQETSAPASKRATQDQLGGAINTAAAGGIHKKKARWVFVVECFPIALVQTVVNTSEPDAASLHVAEELSKAIYMEAVCELVNPELRAEQLEIARQAYGDVSCDP